MKKIFFNNQFVAFLSFLILIMTLNVNFAKSDCSKICHKAVCKNSLINKQKVISENSVQQTVPGVFPFDDLLIKI